MEIATILFTYNRSWHTKQVLNGLKRNTVLPDKLFIFQDGLKKEAHREEWEKVNALIKTVDFCPVELHVSRTNKGCAHSIVSGINYVMEHADAVIVVEDDCVPAANFMTYMYQCLNKYRDNQQVYGACGCSQPIALVKGRYDVYGCGRTGSWGWATWKDRWSEFQFDNEILERIMADKEKSCTLAAWGSDCAKMLEKTVAGELDAWDIYWTLHVFERDGIFVYPYYSLIDNIGCDGSGLHCGTTDLYKVEQIDEGIQVFELPDDIKLMPSTIEAYAGLYGSYTLLNNEESKENVVIYGIGAYFRKYEKRINEKYYVKAVMDKKLKGWFAGRKIVDMEDVEEYSKYKILIMVKNAGECNRIIHVLTGHGVKRENIMVGYKLFGDAEVLNDERVLQWGQWCLKRPIDNHKIVMRIGMYGSHARQITRMLLRKSGNLDIVWVTDQYTTPISIRGVRIVQQDDWKTFVYEMETAKIWLWDDLVPDNIVKRAGQVYIQVKHWSSITLKKFYLDDHSPVLTDKVADYIRRDGARMDYLLSGSQFDEDSCRSGFAFGGKAIRVGSPRSDVLFDKQVRNRILDYYQLPKNAKICLYVPTYRLENLNNPDNVLVSLDMETLTKSLESKWDGIWYLLVRVHPCLKMDWSTVLHNDRIKNAEKYPDSEELVAAADVMITDYSSIMFEQAYKNGTVFLYAPDKQDFVEGERDLLIKYDELPFPIAETNEELMENISAFSQNRYTAELSRFMQKYGVHEDGHASERAADFIMKLIQID